MKFGNYETTTEIARVDGITVYRARNDVSESFVIKVFSIPHFAGKDEQKVKEFNELFYSRVEAHKKAALNSQHIVPILQFGVREEIAWYVTNFYPSNLEKLLAAKLSLDRQQFFELVQAVVKGALDFKRYCGRAHGNLKLPNVLLTGDVKHKIGKAMLTDPPPGDSATPTAMELADLKFIGELMYRLVYPHETRMIDLRKLPIMPTSQKWVAMFGDHSRDWFELCNRLLDPKIALDKFNLERLDAELQRLRPEPKRAGGNMAWIGIGVAAAIAIVIGVVYFSGNKKPSSTAASKPSAPKVSAGPTQAELDAKRQAEEKSRQEAARLAAEQKKREETSRQAEAEAKQRTEEARQLEEQRQQAIAAAEKARQEAAAQAADAKTRQEADARRQAEEAKIKKLAEEMARLDKAKQEASAKAAVEEKLRLEAVAKRQAEEARAKQLSEELARLEKAKQEATAQAAEAERLRKEAEAKRVAEEAKTKQATEELARKQREAQEAARQQALAQAQAQTAKPTPLAATDPVSPIIRPQGTKPVGGKKWVNSLDMRFTPVGNDLLFCVWETRRKDYEAFIRESRLNLDNNWKTAYFKQDETEPVINVSLTEAQAFCKWLTERERQAGLLGGNQSYRLPSDAEWIQANAQPASDLAYPWGTAWPPPAGAGNYATTCSYDGFENTASVGQFMANANGLFDMGGNAWELCLSGTQLSVRGGSWQTTAAEQLNNAYHQTVANGQRAEDIGFRCVLVTR